MPRILIVRAVLVPVALVVGLVGGGVIGIVGRGESLSSVQRPLEVWLGGRAPSELRRVGRAGDGWLPSFSTPEEVAEGWQVITEVAAAHDRRIDPEHFGVLVAFALHDVPDPVRALLARRRGDRDPAEVIPVGLDALRARIEAFLAVGASKFVVTPLDPIDDVDAHLHELGAALLDLTT